MHFGGFLNKTISEWQGQNFPCYNKMNRNGARTVADQIVRGDMRSIYPELALCGSKNEFVRTDIVLLHLSEVSEGTVSLRLSQPDIYSNIYELCMQTQV